ncbi:hypothetical protein [Vibrio cyclitrophicus]|nr:hypothetical protein [Vibrio cyclitrophicus]
MPYKTLFCQSDDQFIDSFGLIVAIRERHSREEGTTESGISSHCV